MSDLEHYLEDVRRRPLEINDRRPRGERLLCIAAGACIGHAVMALIYGWPWWWAALLLGVVLATTWWFGIASDSACARRYERARIAAIYQRRQELGEDGQ